jgi:PRTRC genetic system ParB family protein
MQDLVQPTLKVRQIVSGHNHRVHYDPKKMAELEEGVKAAGRITQPVQVRPHPTHDDLWEIVAGERRWRVAGKLFGADYDLPVNVSECTDTEARALGIIENHYRDDPSDVEQARGAADLLQLNNGNKDQTARQLGWSSDTLDRRLLLLQCTPDVQMAVIERRILLGHAELLAGLHHERQGKVLAGILEHKVPVDVLRKQLGQFAKRLADAIFDTAQCIGCPHNSARQAALFDESIGEGYCQHPSHYEELTLAALETTAAPLREQYAIVRIVRLADGFTPLTVSPDGNLGVGAAQYAACKACANYGCSVSALPGSYGQIDASLCFDAQCHATKVAERRLAERAARQKVGSDVRIAGKADCAGSGMQAPCAKPTQRPSSQTPPRVVQYREQRWRAWVANALMADPLRNHRVLAALIASSSLQSFDACKFVAAVVKLVEPARFGANGFKGALELADVFDGAHLPAVVRAVTASAAYGVSAGDLELLLNYLGVNEEAQFALSSDYLELLTMTELEALAEELELRKAMGETAFKKARAGTKPLFIKALLHVDGFVYAGLVPKAMRYPRRSSRSIGANEASRLNELGAAADPDMTGIDQVPALGAA